MNKRTLANSGYLQKQLRPLQKEQGVVLIVGLIMVLLMTIVGLAAIRGSGLQETMAGNMRDRNLAFQAAEAGLRVGEQYIEDNALTLAFDGTETGLYMNMNDPGNTGTPVDEWESGDWTSSAARSTGLTLNSIKTANAPLFVAEKLEVDMPAGSDGGAVDFASLDSDVVEFYRITSRGLGGTDTAEAIVQSTYKP